MTGGLNWERVDASWLPAGDGGRGGGTLEATYHADGQLARLAAMRGGECIAELVLEHGLPRGVERWPQGSGGTADWTTYRDGFAEQFDAWSDNARPVAIGWRAWCERAIRRIVGAARG